MHPTLALQGPPRNVPRILLMALIHPIRPLIYQAKDNHDISGLIAPPYDVLDEDAKAALLSKNDRNFVAVDLPHLPAKTVGPDEAYEQAGNRFRQWLDNGVMGLYPKRQFFVYRQTFQLLGHGARYQRMGLFAGVAVQRLGESKPGHGGIYPHEETFSGPKEDRLKLMRTTRSQLSPIFGLYSDADQQIRQLLDPVTNSQPLLVGRTDHDDVLHEVWAVSDAHVSRQLVRLFETKDVFIADGHHRYNTAVNYQQELIQASPGISSDHPANDCLFVLVAFEDPGMQLGATHRVFGGIPDFNFPSFCKAADGLLKIETFSGDDLEALVAALATTGPHAMGFYVPSESHAQLYLVTTTEADPLSSTHGDRSLAWRQLDVSIVQHLVVERICKPLFIPSDQRSQITWKFPHTLAEVREQSQAPDQQFGVILQPVSIEEVQAVSQAGELMPQKSTFFYPKLASGLLVHPLEQLASYGSQ